MIPLSDGIGAQQFPIVNVALIVANFAGFLFCGCRTTPRRSVRG
jgi:hypothetical protein